MANGGELGYHGYNHQPLSPSSVNYGEKYVSYKTWKDKAAMKAGLSELISFLSTNSFLKHKNQSTFHHQIFFRKKDES